MIGAAASPMSMFTGGGNEAFQRGMMIGNANSPFSTVADALRSTVDKYNAHLTAQQEQANKLEQINATSAASLGNDKAIIDYKRQGIGVDPDTNRPTTVLDLTTNKYFYKSTTIDSSGIPKVSWAPVSINAPETPKQKVENSMYQQYLDQNNSPSGSSPIPGVPTATTPSVVGQGVRAHTPTHEEILAAKAQGFTHYDSSTGQFVK